MDECASRCYRGIIKLRQFSNNRISLRAARAYLVCGVIEGISRRCAQAKSLEAELLSVAPQSRL
jgi:DNA-binding SARP family transcriptional activator